RYRGVRGRECRQSRQRFLQQWGALAGAPLLSQEELAVLLERPGADLALLEEPGGVDHLPVRLVERDRRDDVRRLLCRAVRNGPGGLRGLAVDQRDRRGRGDLRELPRVLPDRHRLPPADDVLEALRCRILTRDR